MFEAPALALAPTPALWEYDHSDVVGTQIDSTSLMAVAMHLERTADDADEEQAREDSATI